MPKKQLYLNHNFKKLFYFFPEPIQSFFTFNNIALLKQNLQFTTSLPSKLSILFQFAKYAVVLMIIGYVSLLLYFL